MTLSAFHIGDMHCARCAARVEATLVDAEGVLATFVNPARKQLLVEHAVSANPLELMERIERAGFHPHLGAQSTARLDQRDLLKRLGVAGIAMMQVMMTMLMIYSGEFHSMEPFYRQLFEYASLLLTVPVVAWAARPFYASALRSLRVPLLSPDFSPNMDVPIALAIVLGFAVSLANTLTGAGAVYYDSVTMFTFLLLTARYVDDRLKQRFEITNASLAALPATALVITSAGRERRPLPDVAPGTRIWVAEGAQVPLDGIVIGSDATLDESMLTGESLEVVRRSGAEVWAGSLNRGAGFEVESRAPYDGSRIAGIAELADRAQSGKPPAAEFADRIARWFVPGVLTLAALAWLAWQFVEPSRAFVAALCVLVVSCPCALSLATPATFTAAMTRLRQAGVVLTRSSALETLADVDRALLDKTGTLTRHAPALQTVEPLALELFDRDTVLDLAAALQRHASHPLARAFPEPRHTAVTAVATHTGAGVAGEWQGHAVRIGKAGFCGVADDADGRAVYLTCDGAPIARFLVDDPLREDARATVDAFRSEGIVPVMLSGDSPARCSDVAALLGIDFAAAQTPESKLAFVRDLQRQGARVLVVGDGINDIPVLAAADVSATVLETSDLVRGNADVLLLTRRLGALVDLVRIARRTRRVQRQNLVWALAYNLVAVPFAALGLIAPWIAAVGMAGSSMLVMLNASRLLAAPVGAARPAAAAER
jgi:Cu2+-exporting ATPase